MPGGVGFWKTPPGTGGGAAGFSRFWVRDSVDLVTGTLSGTVVVPGSPNMSFTVPSDASARTAFCSFGCTFSGGHTQRFLIYDNGVAVWPIQGTGGGPTAQKEGTWNGYDISFANIPITLAAGTGHLLELRWEPSDNTTSLTLADRHFTADVFVGTTSPL